MLKCCDSGVTALSQWCDSSVVVALQSCKKLHLSLAQIENMCSIIKTCLEFYSHNSVLLVRTVRRGKAEKSRGSEGIHQTEKRRKAIGERAWAIKNSGLKGGKTKRRVERSERRESKSNQEYGEGGGDPD
jgi:hypothetical protein